MGLRWGGGRNVPVGQPGFFESFYAENSNSAVNLYLLRPLGCFWSCSVWKHSCWGDVQGCRGSSGIWRGPFWGPEGVLVGF